MLAGSKVIHVIAILSYCILLLIYKDIFIFYVVVDANADTS